jgi:hypothetical protein
LNRLNKPFRGSDSGSNPDSGAPFLYSFEQRSFSAQGKKCKLEWFEIHITDSGWDIFDDRGKGHRSDLVITLGLAVWATDYDGYSSGPMFW